MPDPITPVTPAPATPAPATPATPPVSPAVPVAEPAAEAPKYTDKQLNDLLARDAGKEVKKMLAEAGFDPSGDIKADLAKLKSVRDSQMTAEQKAAEAAKAKDDELTASKREASEARAEAAALKLGVPADKCDRVRKLAMAGDYEGSTEAEKVAAVLADFPEFVKAAAPGDIGRRTGGSQVNEEEELLAKMKKNAGIK